MSKARNGEGSIFPAKDKKTGKTIGYNVEISLGQKADGKRDRTRRRVKTMKEAVERHWCIKRKPHRLECASAPVFNSDERRHRLKMHETHRISVARISRRSVRIR